MAETKKDACICCEGTKTESHLRALLRCLDCGHVWADISLSPEELADLYSADYFHGEEYVDYEHESAALRRNFKARAAELAKRHEKGSKLWEIGCAYGYFLQVCSTHFDAAGCDISEDAAKRARDDFGVRVSSGDYLTQKPEHTCDVICLWDTVEHLDQPQLCIEKAANELRSGGELILSTGDIGSICARMRGAKWRLIHPPTHLHYFTTNSISVLLNRLSFENIEIRHHAFWRSADATVYELLCRGGSSWRGRLYRSLRRAGLLNFSYPLNLFDLMTVRATKS